MIKMEYYVPIDMESSVPQNGKCVSSDISATDVSTRTCRPQTFRPQKMPKEDVSAITIHFGFGMYVCI